jgi:hypothetical protein
MTRNRNKVTICGLGAIVLASMLSAAAYAQTRTVPTHAARHNAPAANSNLGDYDPWGRPATAGCTWSRLQVPTPQGLRWEAVEDCDPDMWH